MQETLIVPTVLYLYVFISLIFLCLGGVSGDRHLRSVCGSPRRAVQRPPGYRWDKTTYQLSWLFQTRVRLYIYVKMVIISKRLPLIAYWPQEESQTTNGEFILCHKNIVDQAFLSDTSLSLYFRLWIVWYIATQSITPKTTPYTHMTS